MERLLSAREPPSSEVKRACANVLRALGACGGAFLWANSLAGFEAAKALCLTGLADADPAVRAAFAQALAAIAVASSSGAWQEYGSWLCRFSMAGAMGASGRHGSCTCPSPRQCVSTSFRASNVPSCPPLCTADAAKDSCRALEKKPKYKAAQEKALGDVPTACLTTPFVEAASYSNRPVCTALAQAWAAYLTATRAGGMEEQVGAGWVLGAGGLRCCISAEFGCRHFVGFVGNPACPLLVACFACPSLPCPSCTPRRRLLTPRFVCWRCWAPPAWPQAATRRRPSCRGRESWGWAPAAASARTRRRAVV